ncbi:MAG: J domain-containing protein [Bacteroidetes bacterium]|nr:J domain-containing protein [Bacteroidota bacterium]
MNKTNFYKILEIEDFSEIDEIKKAFRRLALIYHPDINKSPQASEKFKMLVKAYETLKNTESKKKYDELLKNGFDFSDIFSLKTKSETEYERRKKQYFRMRKEKDELDEVENIASYEKSLRNFPYSFRIVFLILINLSGIFLILDDWYKKGSFIFLGAIVIFITSIVFWNEIFKHYWHKSVRMTDTNSNKLYENYAYSNFIKFFTGGILILILLINAKKIWHLHYFGTVVVAENNYEHKILIYSFNKNIYTTSYINLPDNLKAKDEILIKISSKEPEIWEIAEK